MKSFDQDFTFPQRQSPFALIFLAYKYFKIVVRTIWPMAIALLVGKDNYKELFFYGLIIISILLIIYTVIDYLRFYFHIENDELVIEKGVFKRSKTNIPFERIQSINLEQGVLHQFLNVSKVEIDTAGSKEIEFSFSAFDIKKAEILRTQILKKRTSTDVNDEPELIQQALNDELILSLTFTDLIKLGITQNHVKSFFIILAFLMSVYAYTDDLGIDAYEMSGKIGFEYENIWKTALLAFAVFAVAVSFIYSMIRTIIFYFQFRIYRTFDGYSIISGLFNRKHVTARDKKIQIIGWSDNPLKRIAGISDIYLKQASSIAIKDKDAVIIPGCNRSAIERIKNDYFVNNEWEGLKYVNFSDKIIIYKLLYHGLLPSILISVTVLIYGIPILLLISLIWIAIVFIASKVSFNKRKCSLNEHILYIQNGLFENNNEVLRLNKIQSISLRQNLYQKRNGLSDVIVYTAAGKILLPFLGQDDSRQMVNHLLYKVETDHNKWM